MNTSPSQEDPSDEVTEVYRRLSNLDPSRPSSRVREAIHAHARLSSSKPLQAAAVDRLDSATPSANHPHWQWRAAAGIAVVGLAGLIAWQQLHLAAPFSAPSYAARTVDANQATSEPTTPVGSRAPDVAPIQPSLPASPVAPAPTGSREAAGPYGGYLQDNQSSRVPSGRFRRSDAGSPQGQTSQQSGADLGTAAPSPALGAEVVPSDNSSQRLAPAARLRTPEFVAPTESSDWQDKVLLAVRASYPELFNGAGNSSSTRVTIVLKSDGSVFRTARDSFAVGGQVSAAEQIEAAFGIYADDLDMSGVFVVPRQSTGSVAAINVIFGILK